MAKVFTLPSNVEAERSVLGAMGILTPLWIKMVNPGITSSGLHLGYGYFLMKAENFKTGYNSNLGGIALGADYTINDMYAAGP